MFGEIIKEIANKRELRNEELLAMMPHFGTEEDALIYAVRLANLRRGDRVKAPYGNILVDHVFLHFDGDSAYLMRYEPNTKTIGMNRVAPTHLILD